MTSVHNQNLLYALSDSHLDLNTFSVSKDKEDDDQDDEDDDEDNVSEHELAEEESDIKIESVTNSTKASSPTKMRMSSNSHQGTSKPKSLIGRDSNGQFKDHQSFLKMRNLINKQEDGHQAMFEKIIDKLQDEEFFQQVL